MFWPVLTCYGKCTSRHFLPHVPIPSVCTSFIPYCNVLFSKHPPLEAYHLTLEGGVGDFEKKIPASACRKKQIACSTNVIEKNSCTAVRKKKNVAKLFHHSRGLYKIPAKLQPFSSLATFELWIWWCCRIIASYVQCIISLSQAVMKVNFSIKESSFDRQRKLTFFIFNFSNWNIFM